MVIGRDDPQLTSKYIPQYRPGMNYNFSDAEGFQKSLAQVSRAEANRALRILIDFMKSETMKSKELTYEPLLTQLI
jgi:hypothetical protein